MRLRAFVPLLITLGGCNLFGSAEPPGKSVYEAYGGSHELRVLDVDSPLRARKKVPVLSTPEVFAVYVPSHAERDLLIGEHWLFFKLKDAEWFVERLQSPDPPAAAEAPVESLRPLRDLDWNKVVIPHKSSP